MNRDNTYNFEMLLNVDALSNDYLTEFTNDDFARQQFEIIREVIGLINEQNATASASGNSARQGTSSKEALRDELNGMLDRMRRAARAMASTQPGIEEKFAKSRKTGDQALLAEAKSAMKHAETMQADFIKRGAPDNFIQELGDTIKLFEETLSKRNQEKMGKVAANAAIEPLLERGLNAVKELDAIMHYRYHKDAGKLAKWLSASHTKQRPSKKKKPDPTPQSPVN